MKPITLLNTAIFPALKELQDQHGIQYSAHAARFLLAIALQESNLSARRQVVASGAEAGPAASFWQFEQGGAATGVLTHHAVAAKMKAVCEAFNVLPTPAGLWEAMRYQDIVAACAARLLIYTLPGALPTTADQAWQQYLSAWRPGKPKPDKWAAYWKMAGETVGVA